MLLVTAVPFAATLGLSEEQIEEIEEKYWRGEDDEDGDAL